MARVQVEFLYRLGISRDLFAGARLKGSWGVDGRYADDWTVSPMDKTLGDDGCPEFRAVIGFEDDQVGIRFRWGVEVERQDGVRLWGIPTEVNRWESTAREREFTLRTDGQQESHCLTHCRRLGANKHFVAGEAAPRARFAVWAPNARAVEVVMGDPSTGYIDDLGIGVRGDLGPFPMAQGADGVWSTVAGAFHADDATGRPGFDHQPYMYRITKDNGRVVYRTDLYSRCQIGSGRFDPQGQPYNGQRENLDGSKSCSVVVDPDRVTEYFSEPVWPEENWLSAADFWNDPAYTPQRPLPRRVEDMVIYELHVGGLGIARLPVDRAGTLEDAIELLDYLVDLGVNAVELLPMNEFEGWAAWGYGTSHYFAVEYSGGGRDQLKHFVRECHKRGIAVILDVVYNHYHHNAERAEWAYDSDAHERNIYYWYEGRPEDYPAYEQAAANTDDPNRPVEGHSGYIDNGSTGYAPRFSEEMVRKLFISSAVTLMEEFHVDGFRVDQTTSIHSYAVLHANGAGADQARIFGAKFLRELSRTLKLIDPNVVLLAEDHSEWDAVTRATEQGGLGFDAAWYADFYHHLIGDSDRGSDYAKLIRTAGEGGDGPLAMDYFSGALAAAADRKVVYHESHDEAGNSSFSGRTMAVAVNRVLNDSTRRYAEARSRLACGLTMLAPGTPMFFMGEEVGAAEDYRHDDFLYHRTDLRAARNNSGRNLFRYYQDVIQLRFAHPALRTREIEILGVHNANRVIAFQRRHPDETLLVLASLNNAPYANGYAVYHDAIDGGDWREVFNSDAAVYGGDNVGNASGTISTDGGRIDAVIPANGFLVLQRT